MPASYTHQYFGEEVLKKISDKDVKTIIKNNLNYYNIGLQGPDILFFYQPLKKNSINDLGNRLHENIATEFFQYSLEILKNNYDERALAYTFGAINHFILDSTCHGYIDKVMSEKNIGHFEIERDLDQRFMNKNNLKTDYYVAKFYTINQEVAKVIAQFYQCDNKTMLSTLKYFRFINHLFSYKSKVKYQLVSKLLNMFNGKKYQSMIIREIPEQKIIENIDILVSLFNEATKTATEEIIAYYYCCKINNDISKRFNCNYE